MYWNVQDLVRTQEWASLDARCRCLVSPTAPHTKPNQGRLGREREQVKGTPLRHGPVAHGKRLPIVFMRRSDKRVIFF
jgi:hypothetical protein